MRVAGVCIIKLVDLIAQELMPAACDVGGGRSAAAGVHDGWLSVYNVNAPRVSEWVGGGWVGGKWRGVCTIALLMVCVLFAPRLSSR